MNKFKKWGPGIGSVDQFFPRAKKFRHEFDTLLGDPIQKVGGRFVWDSWHVPQQYSHLRSPLNALFSEEMISDFLDHLSQWSQHHLGLSSISLPWASAYLNNHYQGLHTDAKHGPWAFVYSLTPDSFSKRFRGGHTRIARIESFAAFSPRSLRGPQEEKDFWIDIAPRFNRLTLFDPRRPHCVTKVQGPEDIREARLVIHGWFSDPRPFYRGSISKLKAAQVIECLSENCFEQLKQSRWCGLLPLRVSAGLQIKVLHHQLVDLESQEPIESIQLSKMLLPLQQKFNAQASKIFKRSPAAPFEITLPLQLEE